MTLIFVPFLQEIVKVKERRMWSSYRSSCGLNFFVLKEKKMMYNAPCFQENVQHDGKERSALHRGLFVVD